MGNAKAQQAASVYGPEFSDFIGEIYQAGLEPERWPDVLKRISATFDADLACIYTPVVNQPEQALYITHNFDKSAEADFRAYYHRIDAWTQAALERDIYIQGYVTFGESLISPRDLHRTEFFNDFCKPHGLEWIVTTALFDGRTDPHTPATHMTFTRHPDHGAFGAEQSQLIQQLAPHVRRALLTHWRLTEARLQRDVRDAVLGRLGYGLAVLDPGGRVLHLNAAAERTVRAGSGLSIQGGRLAVDNPADQEALGKMIREASLGVGGGMCVERRKDGETPGRPYCLSASPLQEGASMEELTPLGLMPQPGALLLIHDPDQVRAKDAFELFLDHHRLTPAEARVLRLLLRDLAPKQIAAHLNVAVRTVRTQLSSLFHKTGTRNQRELLNAVLAHRAAGY